MVFSDEARAAALEARKKKAAGQKFAVKELRKKAKGRKNVGRRDATTGELRTQLKTASPSERKFLKKRIAREGTGSAVAGKKRRTEKEKVIDKRIIARETAQEEVRRAGLKKFLATGKGSKKKKIKLKKKKST